MQDIKVGEGQCSAVLPTTARFSNPQGHLHAGCYCSLVDLISTTALAAADRRQSITISVDFFAPLAIGEELLVEAHMVKPGKTLTFAEVNFRWAIALDLLGSCTVPIETSMLVSCLRRAPTAMLRACFAAESIQALCSAVRSRLLDGPVNDSFSQTPVVTTRLHAVFFQSQKKHMDCCTCGA